MKKIYCFAFLLALTALAGCTPKAEEKKSYPFPDEMKGCKVFELYDGNRTLHTVWCPHADTSTTTSCGKSCTSTASVITGE